MTAPDPEAFGSACARGCASLVVRIPQYVVYFTLVLVASRAAYPNYPWRTILRDSAIGFVIFAIVGLIERRGRHELGKWTTSIERRAVGAIAKSFAAQRARRARRDRRSIHESS